MHTKPVLGVFYWHNPTRLGNLELINALRRDFTVLIISNEYVSYIQGYCDDLIVEPFGDPNKIVELLKERKKHKGLDGLITLSEGAVTLLADSAYALTLIGNDPEKSRFGRNKYFMRQFVEKLGIPQPKCFRARSKAEAKSIIREYFKEQPCFLKPPCIGGSSFCSKITSVSELEEKWDYYFSGSKERTRKDPIFHEEFGNGSDYYMLIEELMGGVAFDYDDILSPHYPIFEMSVEGFIENTETNIYSMTDKLLPTNIQYGEEYMWRMHSRLPKELKTILSERVGTINREIGARVGCSHTEFRIEQTDKEHADIKFDGMYYRARLIETALRPGGAFMQSAIQLATGFNSIRAMAFQSCGMHSNESILYRKPSIMANFWAPKSGKIKRIEGLDFILSQKHKLAAIHFYDGINDYAQIPPIASRGMADAVIIDTRINLMDIPDWEILSKDQNPYRDTEVLYLDFMEKFKVDVE